MEFFRESHSTFFAISKADTPLMKIVTYNIHKAQGLDGKVSLKRITDVLADIDADIVALQEIFGVCDSHEGQVEKLAHDLGLAPAL